MSRSPALRFPHNERTHKDGAIFADVLRARCLLDPSVFVALDSAAADGYFKERPTPCVDEIARDVIAYDDETYLLARTSAGLDSVVMDYDTGAAYLSTIRACIAQSIHVWLARNGL